MRKTDYKKENYERPDIPVYSSVQSGREELAILHHHDAAEIIIVLSGRVRVLLGDSYSECAAGDIIYIPPMMMHGVTSVGGDAAIRGVTFESRAVGLPEAESRINELLMFGSRTEQVIGKETKGYRQLYSCLEDFDHDYGDFSLSGRLRIRAGLLRITACLADIYDIEESTWDKDHIRLRPVLEYVSEHYTEQIRISELSGMLNVCDDRLIRLFKEVTGKTPVEYIMSLRIEHALRLLSATDMPIADIAGAAGFGSDTYMTRTFRARLDMTPGQYRRCRNSKNKNEK